eukprot:GDKH01025530.1.p1 GENE.GDKH01025530.1~~GDKH01025530.1.p1  ORF type:complete len:224 (+),score=29.86 GDKH01025530.1:122-793(+)
MLWPFLNAVVLRPFHNIIWLVDFIIAILLFPISLVVVLLACLKHTFTKGIPNFEQFLVLCSDLPYGLGMPFIRTIVIYNAPYAGSMNPNFKKISISDEAVTVAASIRDRSYLMNPFDSIHALALGNLGEMVSGLAVFIAMKKVKGARGIPTSIHCTYTKKARNVVSASCTVKLADLKEALSEKAEQVGNKYKAHTPIFDEDNEFVCQVVVEWTMKMAGPKKSQ